MKLTKIEQPQSFRQHAYDEIKNAIINHAIAQGEVLYERDLSEKLGISRTPLRAAIQMLEVEGWLKSVPRKGVFISRIVEQDVEEVLQLRRANESLVMELIIPKISDADIEKLEHIYAEQKLNEGSNEAFIMADKDFHMYLAELTGNGRLTQLMHNLSDQMRWFGITALKTTDRKDRTLKEHRIIIEGLKKRDVDFAKKAVIEHIEHTRSAVLASLKLQ
ncbi:GntR family transcriptional regulator [Paenibacillus caui]|uniref:GntR family transcriptional regulator n=1 Tax=Paenibacillus caui TaxID=2873927 RepID=UPI001CA88FE9|nr:GntR family transcriptional regulator [Paenibacillus caui]